MSNKRTIFWCGSILNYNGLQLYKGEAPSATQWSYGLINGIKNNDIDVKTFSAIWDAKFPKGKLFPTDKSYLENTIDQQPINYINLPIVRSYLIAYSLKRHILSLLNKKKPPIAILTYNLYPHYVIALKEIIKIYPEITWVNLVLDLDNPEIDGWNNFLYSTKGSKGSVFLSWWGFQNAPIPNKLHLDSGWDGILPKSLSNTQEKKIIYAGKLSNLGGIDIIINAIKQVKEKNIIFEFYGKGYNQNLELLAQHDSRVIIKGFVSDKELEVACSHAIAFLSPRDSSAQETKMIFPSKILYYLKFRKPIISELLPGLSPDYNDILVVPASNSPISWANEISFVVNLPESYLTNLETRILVFLQKKKWQNQAKKLIDFIESLNN